MYKLNKLVTVNNQITKQNENPRPNLCSIHLHHKGSIKSRVIRERNE